MIKKGMSLKQRKLSNNQQKDLAWAISRSLTGHRRESDCHKHFCPICGLYWCLNGHDQSEFCQECIRLAEAKKPENAGLDFSQACMLEVGKPKHCDHCRRKL